MLVDVGEQSTVKASGLSIWCIMPFDVSGVKAQCQVQFLIEHLMVDIQPAVNPFPVRTQHNALFIQVAE